MKRYSRLASVEQKRNIKSAYFYIILSIIAVILLVFLGLPILVKFAGFIGDIAKSDKPVDIIDNTPPAPPQFSDLPEYSNDESLEINGRSESGATVTLLANNDPSEVIVNNEGNFNFTFNLLDGENKISASAKDPSGNESIKTGEYIITFDNKEPKLELTSPSDGASFFGSGQRQLSVKGNVDEAVELTINGRTVSVKDDNTFSFATTLSEGENKFEVKAIDKASNENSISFTVNFAL